MTNKITLEVCAFTLEACRIAERAGANRIELCDNPGEGGTTPSAGMIELAKQSLHIDVFPIIRPRGGDFLYSDEEFAIMEKDVLVARQLGCEGVVMGLLLPDGRVDIVRTRRLVQLAYPMEVSFHRAFDRAINPLQALEDVIAAGCQRILSSGQVPAAPDGAALLAQLVQAAGHRISIMPGSGVRSGNVAQLIRQTGATEVHSSARIKKSSAMEYHNPAMQEEGSSVSVDEAEVRAIRSALDEFEFLPQP